MSKIIQVTGRPGVGTTTIASMIAEKLSEMGITLIIDNSVNKTIYNITIPVTMDIRPYIAMNDDEKNKKAIKDCAIEIRKNFYYISSTNESRFNEAEIKYIKKLEIFDYIIIDDTEKTCKFSEYDFVIINPNIKEQEQNKNSDAKIIVNRYDDEIEFKLGKGSYRIYFSPAISNFNNGFELNLNGYNKKEINNIIQLITGNKIKEKSILKKFKK